MALDDREELVDMIAQAVIDKMEERDRIMRLADLVVARVVALQSEKSELEDREAVLHEQRNGEKETSDV